MALHIDPEIQEKYAAFYDFALHMTSPENTACFIIEQVDDDGLAAQIAAAPRDTRCVIVRDCPTLKSLAPLCALPSLTWAGVWRCKKAQELWNTAAHPLEALVLVDCKALRDLGPLTGCAPTLHHLFLQGRAWSVPRIQSVDPLARLSALVTCDLAVSKADGGSTIYFEQQWPALEALTITPNLAKYFKRVKE